MNIREKFNRLIGIKKEEEMKVNLIINLNFRFEEEDADWISDDEFFERLEAANETSIIVIEDEKDEDDLLFDELFKDYMPI